MVRSSVAACFGLAPMGVNAAFPLITGLTLKSETEEHPYCWHGERPIKTGDTVTGNLNEGSTKGAKLRLCMETEDMFGKVVTDLMIAKSDKQSAVCPSGWEPIQHSSSVSGDLNEGSGGNYETLCLRRDDNQQPITDLKLQEDTICGDDWKLVQGTNGSPDINDGHDDGKTLYLCAKKDEQCFYTATPKGDVTGYWQRVSYKGNTKNERTPYYRGVTAQTTVPFDKAVTDAIMHGESKVKAMGTTQAASNTDWTKKVNDAVSGLLSYKYNVLEHTKWGWSAEGYVWQWVVDVESSCGNMVTYLTEEMVLSESNEKEPCCIPGGTLDRNDASTCTNDESLLPGGKENGCRAATEVDLQMV